MRYEKFENLMMTYKKASSDLDQLYKLGFDFAEGKFKLVDHMYYMLSACLSSHYTDDGSDWVSWFIFETDWQEGKTKYDAFDEKKKLIAQDLKGLHDLLESDYKLKDI